MERLMFDAACEQCGAKIRAGDDYAGRRITCPGCHRITTLSRQIDKPKVCDTEALPDEADGLFPEGFFDSKTAFEKPEDDGRVPCPYCSESILRSAIKCHFCGEIVDRERRERESIKRKPQSTPNSGTAAVLSLFFPGVGQIYKGDILAGLLWMLIVAVGYVMYLVPGVIMHVCCVVSASSENRK